MKDKIINLSKGLLDPNNILTIKTTIDTLDSMDMLSKEHIIDFVKKIQLQLKTI